MNNLLNVRGIQAYKPFMYPEAYERYELHEKARWNKDEIPLGEDVKDWHELTEEQQAFLKYTFLLFTQNDVQVGSGYDVLLRVFKPTEVQMMLRNQADRENIHIDAYSYLLDTLGFDEAIYGEFQEINVMKTKLEYIEAAKIKKFEDYYDEILEEIGLAIGKVAEEDIEAEIDYRFKKDLAKMIAVYGGGVEGISLFAQFALLLSYQLYNLMPGMCQIVTWSIRDEEMHVQNNSWLFKQLVKENLDIWTDDLKFEIYEAFREIVIKEKAYIDYLFDHGATEGVTKYEMYSYIEYIADRRLLGLGLKANYGVKENPLLWMEELLDTPEFANFFTNRVTDYGRSSTKGTWDLVKQNLKNRNSGDLS